MLPPSAKRKHYSSIFLSSFLFPYLRADLLLLQFVSVFDFYRCYVIMLDISSVFPSADAVGSTQGVSAFSI